MYEGLDFMHQDSISGSDIIGLYYFSSLMWLTKKDWWRTLLHYDFDYDFETKPCFSDQEMNMFAFETGSCGRTESLSILV